MSVLLLRLAGPLQSWGSESRFVRRTTEPQPTKSGVLGLLAAALGRRRTDPIEDLVGLRFGVRADQPGTLVRDFQTARSLDGKATFPLSYRYYLADGAFVAAVEGPDGLLEGLDEAVRSPAFPLYLGRRSCPPAGPVSLGLRPGLLRTALAAEPWHASRLHQSRHAGPTVRLDLILDAEDDSVGAESSRDVPISFDPALRQYSWRSIVRDQTELPNPQFDARAPQLDTRAALPGPRRRRVRHEPLDALGGA
ncbi:type I-E CRISPR-associated protein Cas5/CasD [Georgenia sp. TF02-10]|uniref:type I-E CRISPR-associated protein Cas5/CasD n=1 Tax=Georgenia sp. TF02-10 TaxID=2917725 RepID=UPI001FA6C98F|nr:type I-E CRISPR-associated protein Cas5/CasD [Georgenia sp. TF02-10]UNX54048.1 type I-E CRISPR-associated protein Cas5/CasD [Georgenia sp. TF02-10]